MRRKSPPRAYVVRAEIIPRLGYTALEVVGRGSATSPRICVASSLSFLEAAAMRARRPNWRVAREGAVVVLRGNRATRWRRA